MELLNDLLACLCYNSRGMKILGIETSCAMRQPSGGGGRG